jgi:16S rRNA (guanine527-N7)-methyltransferase
VSETSFHELLGGRFSAQVTARLVRYAELLEQWSATHNLVRFRDRKDLVERHLVESLAACEYLAADGLLVDVGSGAGLPGVPLLAACGGWRGVLVEPRGKRWAFLRHVIRELELDATAVRCRYRELASEAGPFDLVTMRAVGGADELLEWAQGRLTAHGQVLLWTTIDELERLGDPVGWRVISSPLPCLQRGRLARLSQCFT